MLPTPHLWKTSLAGHSLSDLFKVLKTKVKHARKTDGEAHSPSLAISCTSISAERAKRRPTISDVHRLGRDVLHNFDILLRQGAGIQCCVR